MIEDLQAVIRAKIAAGVLPVPAHPAHNPLAGRQESTMRRLRWTYLLWRASVWHRHSREQFGAISPEMLLGMA